MLKSQINPHFLFNTLNSIYVLAKKKAEETPEMVLRLSQILDFLLYETGSSQVEIIREIEFIRDYIELEKLRYGKKLEVSVQVDIRDPQRKIEPMIFIPLVENAFKHGVKGERRKAIVHIEISDRDGIRFHIRNSKPVSGVPASKGGIGLKNLQSRLEKIYGEGFRIRTDDAPGLYTVDLEVVKPQSP